MNNFPVRSGVRSASARSFPLRVAANLAIIVLAGALVSCRTASDTTGSIGRVDATPARLAALAAQYDRAPENKANAMNYARALRAAGRGNEVVAILQRLGARYPNDKEVLSAYGKGLAEIGRLKEAAAVLQGAHTPERPDWSVLSAQGSIADRMSDHKTAQAYYASALKIAPGEPSVLSNLGLSYALSGNLTAAEQTLRKAHAHRRADSRVAHNLALVLSLQGKFAEAEAIQPKDVTPEQAAANVAAIRRMISQSNTWRDVERTPQAAGASPQASANPAGPTGRR